MQQSWCFELFPSLELPSNNRYSRNRLSSCFNGISKKMGCMGCQPNQERNDWFSSSCSPPNLEGGRSHSGLYDSGDNIQYSIGRRFVEL
ncbi:hypothetical protein ACOSP7_004215 [Xanthoceras sorbifolium]